MKIASSVAAFIVATAGLCQGHAQTFSNADFEAGNTGFATEYLFATANSDEGQFTVRSDPQNWNGEFVNFGDHTTGAGNMLVVNGATSGNLTIWRQTVSLETNTVYHFRAWTGTAVGGGPANLILKVDGVQVGSSFDLPDAPGAWMRWEQTWISSTNSTSMFEIVNANTSRFPNDFYLDDIGLVKLPDLFLGRDGSDFELRWPIDPAWGLFRSSSMITGSWVAVTNIPTTSGALNILRVPNDAPRAFFRLQRIP